MHRGPLFENMVIAEMIKARYNAGLPMNLYYWRDNSGHEVDVIIDNAGKLYPVEIKSGHTPLDSNFKTLQYWNSLSKNKGGTIVFAGVHEQARSSGFKFINWKNLDL